MALRLQVRCQAAPLFVRRFVAVVMTPEHGARERAVRFAVVLAVSPRRQARVRREEGVRADGGPWLSFGRCWCGESSAGRHLA